MIIVDEKIFDLIGNAFIITDEMGEIIKINKPVECLIKAANLNSFHNIKEIDELFSQEMSLEFHNHRQMKIGNELRNVTIYAIEMRGMNGYIYMFNYPNILRMMDFDSFLDCIGDAVVVTNSEGVMEHANKALSQLSGISEWKYRNLHEVVNKKEVKKSLSLEIIKNKKQESMSHEYLSKKTLFWTGMPILDDKGEVKYAICTGRDITKLIELEENLNRTRRLKNKYYDRLVSLDPLISNDKIVHCSDAMKISVNMAIKAAKSDSPVFIWGESGVGKELIARLVHDFSRRSLEHFIGINCATIPSELMESELFGYERGAFTGANKFGNKGYFEHVRGGTIFLDEVTELPLKMQSKLLRVLQEKEFTRVGGTEVIPFNARIIAATNHSREKLVDESIMRRDFLFRLNVIPIHILPLRERKEDILPLINLFLKYFNKQYNSMIRLSNKLIIRLHKYSWPGNVRELRNIIERLVVTADSEEVSDSEYDFLVDMDAQTPLKETRFIDKVMPLKTAFRIVENMLIKKAYTESGTIAGAANILEIHPSTIHRKLKNGTLNIK